MSAAGHHLLLSFLRPSIAFTMDFNPKYAGCVWKITVDVDHLGNIVWICPVLPGTSADVKIWDKYGPQHTKGCFMEFEVGVHDGAYKGRLHSHVPFVGRKTLTMWQKTYMDVHGYYIQMSKWKKECAPMGHKADTFSVFAT